MKEVLYRSEFVTYRTIFHENYSPITLGEEVNKDYFHFKETTYSQKEEDFVSNFANAMATVQRSNHLIVVEKDEKKVSLKYFRSSKLRKRGVVFFKISKNVDYITVNTETGNFYAGYLHNYEKKRKFTRSIKKNFFVNSPISDFRVKLRNMIPADKSEVIKVSDEACQQFVSAIGIKSSKFSIGQSIIKYYLDRKGVKYPNNFHLYFEKFGYFPTLRKLRRNKMKLVDTVMQTYNFKGDVIKKVLHSLEYKLNLESLSSVLEIFPNSWIQQDENLVRLFLESKVDISISALKNIKFEQSELKNVFNIVLAMFKNEINSFTVTDHILMYNYLKNVGEQIKWKSKSVQTFNEEHLDWTNLYEFYRKGIYLRVYPNELHETLSQPFESNQINYYPRVLTSSSDYNSESISQSNCVKTYIGRPSSLIISLRKNSFDSDERATIEYHIFKLKNVITYSRPQSLGKFNSRLSEDWYDALKILDERMELYIEKTSKDFTTVKIEKILTNEKKLFSDSVWCENVFLCWSFNLIDKNNFDFL